MTRKRDTEAGFTLIEALVAMAVLALGAVSLLSASEGHTARISDVTDRMAAQWAAEYRLSALRLGLADDVGSNTTVLGRSFVVETERTETADPDLNRVTLRAKARNDDRVLFVLDGYLDTKDPI